MKKLLLLTLLILPFAIHAATPTQDTPLNVSLLPNTPYEVTADVTTNDVSALLALLLGGESPLQILDENGTVLGTVPAQDLIDLLTGLTGAVTRQISTVIETAGDAVGNITARTLDDAPTIQVGNVQVRAVSANQAPTVTVKGKHKSGNFLRLRGTASDDQQVARVQIVANGRVHRAHGTAKWNSRFALKEGTNRIVIRAFDNSGTSSTPRRVKVNN